jgi:flotillin
MTYRDDRRALRLRNVQLERELEDARREVELLKGNGLGDEPVGDTPETPEPPRPPATQGSSTMGAVALILLGLGLVLLLRAPVPAVAGTVLVMLGVLSLAVGKLLHIARPNEALVVSGRKRTLPDGSTVGYRIARGRVFRSPFIESAKAIDLSVMRVPVQVKSAHCRGGAAVNVAATAQVKVSSEPMILANGIERFLDQPRESVALAASQTLEGALRETLSTVGLDDVDQRRVKLNEQVSDTVHQDFERLGLELVGLWVIEVDDDDGELTTTRRQSAATELRRVEILSHEARQH